MCPFRLDYWYYHPQFGLYQVNQIIGVQLEFWRDLEAKVFFQDLDLLRGTSFYHWFVRFLKYHDRQVVWFSAMALSIFLFLLQIKIAILHNDLMTFWAIGVTLPQRCLKLSYNKKVLGQLLTRKIAPNPKPVPNPNTSPNPNWLINLINLIHKQNVFY